VENETGFIPIQSLDIEAETRITFDLYVNLPLNQKYILYRRKGGQLDSTRLENLANANVKNFFIHKEDYQEFVRYVAFRIRDLIGRGDNPETRKMMKATAKAILSSTFNENNSAVTGALITNLNDITAVIIEAVLENSTSYNRKTFQRFAELAQKGTDFQKHPVNVTSLVVLLTFGIGYNNDRILSDIAMAALLHDIGLTRLPPTIIAKAHTPTTMTFTERDGLYRHPDFAIEILKERGIVLPELVETIIMQHHEEFNGFGYPRGLRGFAINELSQILHVADELDQLVAEGYTTNLNLKLGVMDLLDRMHRDKIIEPSLCTRIAEILL
jgi:HD-GYP domain-containing protein (c-di-GMP phosphodiesterase class II)